MSDAKDESQLLPFRPWFYAASIYNLVWGLAVIAFPDGLFSLLALPPPRPVAFWQVVGMFVLVYAPAYAWAARRPAAHAHIILIGAFGKILGPIGFLVMLASGELPLRFGVTLVTNDLIWWPAFGAYLIRAARLHGGWRSFILGG